MLTNPIVMVVAAVAFTAEFFADKVPWVDSLWDGFHTFVRPLGAVIPGATVLGPIDPALKSIVVVLCGGVAFASHNSKAATRLAVNHSPEPLSNIGLSLVEDLFAPFGVWLSLKHPVVVLALVCAFLFVFAWVSPKAFRLIKLQLAALWSWIANRPVLRASESLFDIAKIRPEAVEAFSIVARCAAPLPDDHAQVVVKISNSKGTAIGIRCAATKKIKCLRISIGYLTGSDEEILFVAKRFFRYRVHRINLGEILGAELKKGILMNRLVLRTPPGEITFYLRHR